MLALAQARAIALTSVLFGVAAQAAPAHPENNLCALPAAPVALGSAQWNGWGKDLDNTRYQPEPALRAADVTRLALKWAYGFEGSAVAGQVTVVDGRIFALSAAGRVHALDSRTGCTYWTFDAPASARTAISIGELAPSRNAASPKVGKHKRTPAHLEILKAPSAAFFGDDTGAVYALDAQKGSLLWRTQVDAQPSARIVAAPTLYHDMLYVAVASNEGGKQHQANLACCMFRGSLAALDMLTGRVVWKIYTVADESHALPKSADGAQLFGPSGAAIEGAPAIDIKRGVLYVGTDGSLSAGDQPLTNAILALDLTTGAVRWARQFSSKGSDRFAGFGASPVLRTLDSGKQIILAGQKSGTVYGLDPDHGGDVLWQTKPAEGTPAGGIVWGLAADHRNLFMAQSGLMAEPGNMLGSITALDMKTGARRWYAPSPTPACAWGPDCSHAQSQAVTVIPGIAFSGSMDGHLRAYSTIDGKIVWDFDTARDFVTLNGVSGSGGTLDQGGATVVNGMVYLNSGYAQPFGKPGNVLLAFSVDGK